MMKTFLKGSLAVCLALVFTASALAGRIQHSLDIPIPGTDPVASGPGLGLVAVPAVITGTANNDNVPGLAPDNNIVVPLKRFDNLDYIDIEFTVSNTGGVTEYFVSESIDNNTGIDWSGYRMQLGFGTGGAFVKSVAGDGLDFDDPTYDTPPTSTGLPTVITGMTSGDEDELFFTGGTHGAGLQIYQFRIDVPDISRAGGTFTLRQIPIPEPATVGLACIALVGLGLRRVRG
jgi:hypothetical protein